MNSIQGARRPFAGFGCFGPRKLEFHVPVALLYRRLPQPAERMQGHRVEREREAPALGRMQRGGRLAVAVMGGLDAREEERRVAERPARAFGVVGLAEVGLRDGMLVPEGEARLARLGVLLG